MTYTDKLRFLGRGCAVAALAAILLGTRTLIAQEAVDPLRAGFETPPNSARPRVWWHWMNGNVTKEGIKLDLDWMHRIGIGGFQNFDAALNTPQVVKDRLVYMTPEWKEAFRYTTTMAAALGFEEGIASSPGWSETGGPWVPPSQGMKKFVWSETLVQGGKPYMGTLAHPPTITGPFQNIPLSADKNRFQGKSLPEFYADSVVIAYRTPPEPIQEEELLPARITSSGGSSDPSALSDGSLATTFKLPIAAPGGVSWILYEFQKPQTICSLTIINANDQVIARAVGAISNTLEASDDGRTFKVLTQIPNDGAVEHTLSFSATTARFFRVAFKRLPSAAVMGNLPVAPAKVPKEYDIAELMLRQQPRVNRFEEKAGFATVPDLYPFATAEIPATEAIRTKDVIDLTTKLRPDGTLDWTPPRGSWMVLRFGYSLLGIGNHPATAEATGLEVDKLNRNYVKNYMDQYLESYQATVGAERMGKDGVANVVTDSWEAGPQNWTDDMIAQFSRRRGYDPRPWMPVLAGRVVQSARDSDRFLWDFRKTIADMIADEHYGQIQASLKTRGMMHYGESHETGRAFIADGMEVKKLDDIPMSAMWTQSPGVENELYGYNADDRESASVAHIYGQNLAAAESMTAKYAPWAWSPASLKPTVDKEFAEGINRIMIHCSVHQPLIDKAPGLSLGIYGQWFTRNETWSEDAAPWITYLSRSSFLLQQGHFVADVLYFYGEDSNLTAIFAHKSPQIPVGYAFDYVNADALLHMFNVKDGQLITPSGMSYRVLALDPYSEQMSLSVLRRIRDMVREGATVVGAKPVQTPSLADNDEEFRAIADAMWGDGNGKRVFGKGSVYGDDAGDISKALADSLRTLNVKRDFDFTSPLRDTSILFVHRKIAGGDLYYVDNRSDREEYVNATFRKTGSAPELWHADTGVIEKASYTTVGDQTSVPLHLEPWGTVFVVFRGSTSAASRILPGIAEAPLSTISGAWNVQFQPGRGAPPAVTFDRLISWSDSSSEGIKYFSGKATYMKSFFLDAKYLEENAHLLIDLGDVRNLANVKINGTAIGTVWHAPYRLDVTSAVKAGENQLEIEVVNSWVNRLIGDQQPNATKHTFTTYHPYDAGDALQPSGLLGPVRFISVIQAP